jgi:hypothetical protein
MSAMEERKMPRTVTPLTFSEIAPVVFTVLDTVAEQLEHGDEELIALTLTLSAVPSRRSMERLLAYALKRFAPDIPADDVPGYVDATVRTLFDQLGRPRPRPVE